MERGETDHHSDTTENCQFSASNLIEHKNNDACAHKLADVDHAGEDDCMVLVLAEGCEESRSVVDEGVYSGELLSTWSVISTPSDYGKIIPAGRT